MEAIRKNMGVLIVALLIGGGYYAYNTFFATDAIVEQDAEVQVIGGRVLSLNTQLESVSLKQTLFSDPLYQRLIDFSKPLPDLTPGRSNPFAEIGR